MDRFEFGMVALIVGLLVLAGWASIKGDEQRCTTYGRMTGAKVERMGGQCYANRGNGWELVYFPGVTN